MSQPSSSIISADNAETKYKKALKQISKLISANRTLRQSTDKAQRELKERMDQMSLRYEDLDRDYDIARKQKQSLNHYLDEIQKQRNNLERQVAYLNDILSEQNAELKKLNMHKDERAVAALIRTYEQKQATMNRNRTQNEDMITKLKVTVERLQNQLQYERNSKQDAQDRFKRLSLEVGSYKEQNASLIGQVERLLKQSSQKDAYCVEKQKQLKFLVSQLQKQIGMLKTTQQDTSKISKSAQNESYQQLLNQKNKLLIELTKTQSAYQQFVYREKDFYEMQQKMKTAKLQSERAVEQLNMLKSKIVVLEAKQFLEQAGDQDYDQKFFEQRLNLLISQNDPINSIRNQEDSSHFRILKSFIVDLQDKIYKLNAQKKQVARKYKSIKHKFSKNYHDLSVTQQQNKLMKGKLEGFERLTQKLHYQLQKSLANHEQEISRITITSNNLITKKVQQYKTTINFLNSQLEMNQDKANRVEKSLKQQVETLKLELETLRIKYKDDVENSRRQNQLLELFKTKNSELTGKIVNFEDQISNLYDNLSRYEQLFKEQKGKNEGLLSQKQQLLSQIRQLTQDLDKKSSNVNNSFKIKQDQYEFEIRRLKSDNQKLKDELSHYLREVNTLQKDVEDNRRGQQSQVEQIKRLTQKNVQLQTKISQYRRRLRDLEDENETLKIKNKKFQQNYDRIVKLEEQNSSRNDKINDLTREKILLESQIKNLQGHLNEQRKLCEEIKKQLSSIKIKNIQSSHQNKKEFESKIFESKKIIQSLNQDVADLTNELRQEKSRNLRTANELNTVKVEKSRLQQIIQQNRKKDIHTEGQYSSIKLQLSNSEMQIQRLQAQIKNHQAIASNFNTEIQSLQQKIYSLNQELSTLKMKLDSAEDLKSDLLKVLSSFKVNFTSVESHLNEIRSNINIPYQQQIFYNNLADILAKVKRISRIYGLNIDASVNNSFKNENQSRASRQNLIQSKTKIENYGSYQKSYMDSAVKSSLPKIQQTNRNFEANIGTAQSIGLSNKFDYNLSNLSSNQGLNNNSNTNTNEYWSKPLYDYNYSNFQFNYSKGSDQ